MFCLWLSFLKILELSTRLLPFVWIFMIHMLSSVRLQAALLNLNWFLGLGVDTRICLSQKWCQVWLMSKLKFEWRLSNIIFVISAIMFDLTMAVPWTEYQMRFLYAFFKLLDCWDEIDAGRRKTKCLQLWREMIGCEY